MIDLSKWIKNDVLKDHTIHPITINTKIRDFSETYDIHLDVKILAVKKEDK